ncbi:cyclic di-GMP phosphodiesterase response regulator RpfG [Abditibacteriota bacterium]|nr:cyclic di-GMP phosphodiesterase response regulator RpfG [Abditibacteriota bacterium]
MTAPLPSNEVQRLQALRSYHILDTPPEVAFDRITSMAARLFDVPIALVSLVDADRQWFKACFGMDNYQTDRKLSFCAYAILSDEVMAVPDATLDPRFTRHASVIGTPHIRSYAGAPLKTPNGQNLGTICVIDTAPRQFSPEQLALLADLSGMVIDELELRRVGRDLRESEAALRESLRKNSQLTVAITNLTSGVTIADPHLPDNPIVFANSGFYEMTGYKPQEVIGRNCRFLQGPETDPEMVDAMRGAIAERRTFSGVLVNYRKDGTPFLNELIVNPVFDCAGHLLSFVAVQNDVTEREQAKQILEERVRERTRELSRSKIEILDRLARAAEFRDDDTGQHTQRVAHMAALLAKSLGLPAEQVALIKQAAPLHDVGKIAISDLTLLKPGKLTEEEFAQMKTHTTIGATLLCKGHSEAIQMAERIAISHHERWDGKGYPCQLAGEQIPLEGRILAVVDVFDALTHERPYKKAWTAAEAVAEIARQSGQQFDPRVVEAFLTLPHEELV